MSLQTRIEAFLAPVVPNFESPRHPDVIMEDDANGQGSFIAFWKETLGPWPQESDGFSAYELHLHP